MPASFRPSRATRAFLLGLGAVALAGCASMSSNPTATARLEPTRGNQTSGEVRFVQIAGEIDQQHA